MSYGTFEASATDGFQEDQRKAEAALALSHAIHSAKQEFGDFVTRDSVNKQDFKDRVALVKPDLMKLIAEHVMPLPRVVRKVEAELMPDFANRSTTKTASKREAADLGSMSDQELLDHYDSFPEHVDTDQSDEFIKVEDEVERRNLLNAAIDDAPELVPSGDFDGYLDSVDQDAPEKVERHNFAGVSDTKGSPNPDRDSVPDWMTDENPVEPETEHERNAAKKLADWRQDTGFQQHLLDTLGTAHVSDQELIDALQGYAGIGVMDSVGETVPTFASKTAGLNWSQDPESDGAPLWIADHGGLSVGVYQQGDGWFWEVMDDEGETEDGFGSSKEDAMANAEAFLRVGNKTAAVEDDFLSWLGNTNYDDMEEAIQVFEDQRPGQYTEQQITDLWDMYADGDEENEDY